MHAVKRCGLLVFLMLMILPLLGAEGCGRAQTTAQRGQQENERLMERALEKVPTPVVSNFLTREYVKKWVERQDRPNVVYYVYIYSDMATEPMGYYVAQNRPINLCSFLTPPVKEYETGPNGPDPLGPAPGVDGVYYGSGGSCGQWFFFDAETDAMVELTGFKFFSSDQPLELDAPQISIGEDG